MEESKGRKRRKSREKVAISEENDSDLLSSRCLSPEDSSLHEQYQSEEESDESQSNQLFNRKGIMKKSKNSLKNRQNASLKNVVNAEQFWGGMNNIWTDISVADFEFIQNLCSESLPGFEDFVQAHYKISVENLPEELGQRYEPPLAKIFERRFPPAPPKETVRCFIGAESLSMKLASCGSADDVFLNHLKSLVSPNVNGIPATDPHHVLQTNWCHVRQNKALPQTKREVLDRPPVSINGGVDKKNSDIEILETGLSKKPDCSLGKRGRLYDDIWNEEDFIEKTKRTKFKTCSDWSEILRNYHDDHDGCYIDWILEKLHGRKGKSQLCKKSSTPRPKKEHKNVHTLITEVYSPPVPVSIQHPASWGPGNRRVPIFLTNRHLKPPLASKNGKPSSKIREIDVTQIHPACLSRQVLYPPGYYMKPAPLPVLLEGLTMTSRDTKYRYLEELDDSDGLDELGLETERLLKEIERVSARNYGYLSRILSSMENEMELIHLRETRDRLLLSCQRIAKVMNDCGELVVHEGLEIRPPPNQLKQKNSSQLTPETCMFQMLRKRSHHSDGPSSSPKTQSPSPLSSSLKSDRLFLVSPVHADPLGSVTIHQISFSKFILSLQVGSLVEIRSFQLTHLWSPCQVIGFRYDEAGVLRYVETCSLSGCLGDSQWNAVEDESIAPPGTNLPLFIFESYNHFQIENK